MNHWDIVLQEGKPSVARNARRDLPVALPTPAIESRNNASPVASPTDRCSDTEKNSCVRSLQAQEESPATIHGTKQEPTERESKRESLMNAKLLLRLSAQRSPKRKTFACGQCSKSLTRGADLNRHTRSVHLNVRPYACPAPNCDKIFAEQYNMKRHLNTIHKHPKHLCNTCKKGFSHLYKLKKHVLKHKPHVK